MEDILNRVDKSLEQMKNRPERFDLEALKRNLAFLKERMDKETKETVTQEMERLALLAEDMAKKDRMNEVEALAREMRNRQRINKTDKNPGLTFPIGPPHRMYYVFSIVHRSISLITPATI